jgi:tetratricopeptide (TPR) repeat protein
VIELAEKIKEKGQNSAVELPELLRKAQELAFDEAQDVLTRALAHRAAGNALQLLNQFQPALESYDAAAALLETLDEPVELGRTLHAKVGMLFTLSRFDELFGCSARARELFERCSDHKRLARLDVNLAHAYHRLGRPKEALECSARALRILEESRDSEGFVAASINSAVTLTAMHEFERAEEHYRAAMRVAEELNMSSWVLLSRYNLAYLRYLNGDTAAALDELQIVRREYERINQDWMICQCWLDESEILLEIGDLEDSMAAARRARTFARKLGLNSETGKSLLYEAAAEMRLGRSREAALLLDEAARRFTAEGDQVSTAVAKLQTALLRTNNGDMAALPDAISARCLLRDSGLPHRRALAEIVIGRIQRAAGDLDSSIDSFKTALALAEGSRSQWMQFHAAYELGLSLDQKDDTQSIRMLTQADALLDSLWHRIGSDDLKMSFLADRENVYTYLVRRALTESPATALDYSEKARSRVLRERLMGAVGAVCDRPGRSQSAPTVELAARLSADEVIVEYFISGNDLYIFILRCDGLICIQRRGSVPGLEAEWRDFDRHTESCSVKWERLAPVQHHLVATAQHHLNNLYDELIAPIEFDLRGTVIFVPHGFLHGVPLHALYDGKQYLAERVRVAYTPSASLYCTPAPSQAFGKPLFVAFSTSPDSSSLDEVEEASSLASGATMLINPSIDELRRSFSTARELVHIAGHAGINPIAGKFSWIETAHGRLTSRDLADMHIRARTIVVTGCRTARRIVQPGDEWLGLMRSFYLSGASTIVSALWDIRDETARQFAAEFYKVYNGNNAPAAVQSASARISGPQAHPYFWGGFGAFVRKAS